MCALILGGVVGCLDDPYYIGDNEALSVSDLAATNNTAPPNATDTAPDGARKNGSTSLATSGSNPDPTSASDASPDDMTDDGSVTQDDSVPDTKSTASSHTDEGAASDTNSTPVTYSVLNTDADAGSTTNTASVSGNDNVDAGALSNVEGALLQGHCWPMCYMADSDDVIDGWGTQYERSCVRQGTDAPACDYRDEEAGFLLDGECYAPCPGELLDGDDNDGWAEHNGEACVVTGTDLALSADSCPHP